MPLLSWAYMTEDKRTNLASWCKTTSTFSTMVIISLFLLTLDPVIPNRTSALKQEELEATNKDTQDANDTAIVMQTILQNQLINTVPDYYLAKLGTPMKDTTRALSVILSFTFLINTLSSLTPWLMKTSSSLTNQWTWTNHWLSTFNSKKTVNHL